jgi:hypothetical protein
MRGTLGSAGKATQVQDNREIRRKKGRLDPRRRRSSKNLDYQRIKIHASLSFPNNSILRQPYSKKVTGKTSPSPRLFNNGSMLGAVAGMSPSDGINEVIWRFPQHSTRRASRVKGATDWIF